MNALKVVVVEIVDDNSSLVSVAFKNYLCGKESFHIVDERFEFKGKRFLFTPLRGCTGFWRVEIRSEEHTSELQSPA